MFETGDLVRIEGYFIEDTISPDPNGFVGYITGLTLILYDEGDFNKDEVVYDVNLPIAWGNSGLKHSWTFKDEDLVLLEPR
jgi:hypothetical protein